jgi:hypothetical protein
LGNNTQQAQQQRSPQRPTLDNIRRGFLNADDAPVQIETRPMPGPLATQQASLPIGVHTGFQGHIANALVTATVMSFQGSYDLKTADGTDCNGSSRLLLSTHFSPPCLPLPLVLCLGAGLRSAILMTVEYSESIDLLRHILSVNPFLGACAQPCSVGSHDVPLTSLPSCSFLHHAAKNVCSTTNVLLGPPITYLLARYDRANEQYPFEGFPGPVPAYMYLALTKPLSVPIQAPICAPICVASSLCSVPASFF